MQGSNEGLSTSELIVDPTINRKINNNLKNQWNYFKKLYLKEFGQNLDEPRGNCSNWGLFVPGKLGCVIALLDKLFKEWNFKEKEKGTEEGETTLHKEEVIYPRQLGERRLAY